MSTDLNRLGAEINGVRHDANRDPADKLSAVGHAIATDVVGAASCEEALRAPDLDMKLASFSGLGCDLSVPAMRNAIEFAAAYFSLPYVVTKVLTFDQVRWVCRIPVAEARRAAAEVMVSENVTIDEIVAVTDCYGSYDITADRLAAARKVVEIARKGPGDARKDQTGANETLTKVMS